MLPVKSSENVIEKYFTSWTGTKTKPVFPLRLSKPKSKAKLKVLHCLKKNNIFHFLYRKRQSPSVLSHYRLFSWFQPSTTCMPTTWYTRIYPFILPQPFNQSQHSPVIQHYFQPEKNLQLQGVRRHKQPYTICSRSPFLVTLW